MGSTALLTVVTALLRVSTALLYIFSVSTAMGLGRRDKPPTGSLYPRESYVCFFIFLVELLCTWSLVALIYNNWIFYLPTAAEIEEGFEPDPVMCTTTRHVVSDNCTWWSCMEWCLSATQPPDECIHLYTI